VTRGRGNFKITWRKYISKRFGPDSNLTQNQSSHSKMSLCRRNEFVILTLLAIWGVVGSEMVNYGEKCTDTETYMKTVLSNTKTKVTLVVCNPRDKLQCEGGLCVCGSSSYYDISTETCKSNIGGRCTAKNNCGPNAELWETQTGWEVIRRPPSIFHAKGT